MNRPLLSDSLFALLSAFEPDATSGVLVENAEISLPLEIRVRVSLGATVIEASPPRSIYRAGFEPAVHQARVVASTAPEPNYLLAGASESDHGSNW